MKKIYIFEFGKSYYELKAIESTDEQGTIEENLECDFNYHFTGVLKWKMFPLIQNYYCLIIDADIICANYKDSTFEDIEASFNTFSKVRCSWEITDQCIADMIKELRETLDYLPNRFHEEFLTVILDSSWQNAHSIRKNCIYYLEAILDELNNKEKESMFVVIG